MDRVYNKVHKRIKHINQYERGRIEQLIREERTIGEISRLLERSKSSIWYEIKKGRYNGKYRASIADKRSIERQKRCHLHTKWRDYPLLNFIERHLNKKWSPEIIAKEWNEGDHSFTISHTLIYDLIWSHRPEWIKHLVYWGRRKHRMRHPSGRLIIPNRVDITKRPPEVEERNRVGDIEADTVVSCNGGRSCLAVFVDRMTRYLWIKKIKDKSSFEMERAAISVLSQIKVHTITYDNGLENARHEFINKALGCKSYFCRPYCSADKGSIENRNKLIRQFLPKKTNFDLISDHQLAIIQDAINNRPLKVLGWKSPYQALLSLSNVRLATLI